MERTINEIQIRICDKYPVNFKEVGFDDELIVALKGSIVKREIKDNQDGTVDLVLHFKASDYEITKTETGIKA